MTNQYYNQNYFLKIIFFFAWPIVWRPCCSLKLHSIFGHRCTYMGLHWIPGPNHIKIRSLEVTVLTLWSTGHCHNVSWLFVFAPDLPKSKLWSLLAPQTEMTKTTRHNLTLKCAITVGLHLSGALFHLTSWVKASESCRICAPLMFLCLRIHAFPFIYYSNLLISPIKAFYGVSECISGQHFSFCYVFTVFNEMFYPFYSLLFSPESIRKVLDKQAIKFVRAIKQDTRSGKSEDRILVRDTHTPLPAVTPVHLRETFAAEVQQVSGRILKRMVLPPSERKSVEATWCKLKEP